MKLKAISLLFLSSLVMNAGDFDWFGCFQKCIPQYKCAPAPIPAPTSYTYTVNPVGVISCVPQTPKSLYYNSISSALAAAPAGATILVCPGTYQEQVLITKPISIVGVPVGTAYPTLIPPANGLVGTGLPLEPSLLSSQQGATVAAQIEAINTIGANVSNLLLNGGNNPNSTCSTHVFGIYYQNASGIISGNIVVNEGVPACGADTGYGIYVEAGLGTSGSSTVTISTNGVLNYQTTGILADGSVAANITGNSVALGGPSTFEAPNAIEVSSGVTGSITNNNLANASWGGNPSLGVGVGVLVIASQGLTVSGNTITGSDYGIVTDSDPSSAYPAFSNAGVADGTTITSNTITGTFDGKSLASSYPSNDGIDACSNSNTISGNVVSNFQNSGIHLDSTCPLAYNSSASGSFPYKFTPASSGKSNFVEFNTIANVCTGIAEGGTGNNVWYNSVDDTSTTLGLFGSASSAVFGGDSCTAGSTSSATLLATDFNLYDVLNQASIQAFNQLLESIISPQLIIRK